MRTVLYKQVLRCPSEIILRLDDVLCDYFAGLRKIRSGSRCNAISLQIGCVCVRHLLGLILDGPMLLSKCIYRLYSLNWANNKLYAIAMINAWEGMMGCGCDFMNELSLV